MKKRCVICDKDFQVQFDRQDVATCSVACRSKLHRQRRKAEAQRQARLLSPQIREHDALVTSKLARSRASNEQNTGDSWSRGV